MVKKFLKLDKYTLLAIIVAIVGVSTNEVYGVLIATSVNPFLGLALFSAFALLATYVLMYSAEPNTTGVSRGVLFPLALLNDQIKHTDGKGRLMMIGSVLSYIGYFVCLLFALKSLDAFTVVTIALVNSLLNIVLSMAIFKDRVKDISAFASGFFITVVGVAVFANLDSHLNTKSAIVVSESDKAIGYALLILQVLFGTANDLLKTGLRRYYGFNPESLALIAFTGGTLLGTILYYCLAASGGTPTIQQVFLLLYIGIVPSALVNITQQKLKDELGLPKFSLLQMPRPVYTLVSQGILFAAAPAIAYIGGFPGNFNNPFDKHPFTVVAMLIIILGVYVANEYGKPIKPEIPEKASHDECDAKGK